ncbi:MAG: nickel-dependent lactate racemase [Pseudomonadota bacterium]|nr:nickel-dependent lactate racemase [Pseudomonadota bacterium]
MDIQLKYGRRDLAVSFPSSVAPTIIRKPVMPLVEDTAEVIRNALADPIGCKPLLDIGRGVESVAIAVCDITRPVPNGLFLRPLIECLLQAGIKRSQIKILIATGLHRPNLGDELSEVIGDPWVEKSVEVINHDARDDHQHVLIGHTKKRNTPVRLDRRFVEADLRIVSGLVEPHFMAGYSGGRKVIAPGLAHAETITTFHNARFMGDPLAENCTLVGNPLHEEQLEIVEMLGGAFAVNTVIDESRHLSYINFGEIRQSHVDAVKFVRQYCEIEIDKQFSTVVTTSAGYPLDKTYYQTVKGMVGALGVLRPGGRLIIASEISEGLGSMEYVESQRRLLKMGAAAFMKMIEDQQCARVDEWQTQMQLKAMARGSISLYSTGLGQEDGQLTGVERIDSIETAVMSSVAQFEDPAVAVIPEGPYVVPIYRNRDLLEAVA